MTEISAAESPEDTALRAAVDTPQVAAAQSSSQPAPCATVEAVRADLRRRAALGLAKYGHTVADNPLDLRAWLQHAYEEVLDTAVYLRRAIDEIDRAAK